MMNRMSNRLEKQYQESMKLKKQHRSSRQYQLRVLSQPSQSTRTETLGTPPMHLQSTEMLQHSTSRTMRNNLNRPTKPCPQYTIRPLPQMSTNDQWTRQSPSRNGNFYQCRQKFGHNPGTLLPLGECHTTTETQRKTISKWKQE